MTYPAALSYLYERLPMFTRIGAKAFKKDLTNTRALCTFLDNPENKFPSVHIAGTNGKGSTSHIIAAVLQSLGLKVGLYTSPHYIDFRERIKINGQYVDKKFVCDFVVKTQPIIEQIEPSFFELTVAMAFDYFAAQKVDIAVVEVGLGGRFDSTNVLSPLLSVITNISYDHMDMLGDTLALISFEKAGIIKKNTPVVIGEYNTETKPVFINRAQELNAPIFFASDLAETIFLKEDFKTMTLAFQLKISKNESESEEQNVFSISEIQKNKSESEEQNVLSISKIQKNKSESERQNVFSISEIQKNKSESEEQNVFSNSEIQNFEFETDLKSSFQILNLNTSIFALNVLKQISFFKNYEADVFQKAILQGVANVKSLQKLIGRWQILQTEPLVIADSAHNESGLTTVLTDLKKISTPQLHIVFGFVKDKDITKMLALFPKKAIYYFCNAEIPRALPANDLKLQAQTFGLAGKKYSSCKSAYRAALKKAALNDVIFVGGSIFVVGEILKSLELRVASGEVSGER